MGRQKLDITGWMQNKEQKGSSKIVDIVSYALKMGVTCVFVVYLGRKHMSAGLYVYDLTCTRPSEMCNCQKCYPS